MQAMLKIKWWTMAKAVESIIGLIFTVIVMVIIFMAGYVFLAQFLGATPEQMALHDAKDAIEIVCASDGPDLQDAPISLPPDSKIALKFGGTLELSNSVKVTEKLNCPVKIIFADCTIGPAQVGHESIVFTVIKNQTGGRTEVSLNDSTGSGLVSCAA